MDVILLLLAWGLAQEAPSEAPPAEAAEAPLAQPVEEEAAAWTPATTMATEEVIVWSELQIREAREAVIEAAKRAGYRQELRRGDRTILRHDANYRGEVVLWDDGRMEVKRQPIQFEPWVGGSSPARWLSCILLPLCIRPGGQLVSQRRYWTYQREAVVAIEDEVSDWNERIGSMGLGKKLDGLPARLEALWKEGKPMEAGPALAEVAERKAAILAFWDSRNDNEWGEAVRRTVEAFVRAEIQGTEHAFTEAELADFNARRRAARPLSLVRPEVLVPTP